MTFVSTVLLVMSLLSLLVALGCSVFRRKSEYHRASEAAYYICEAEDFEYLQLLLKLLMVREKLLLQGDPKGLTLRQE